MSTREHVEAICRDMGHDPGEVAGIRITPTTVTFELFMKPKQWGADGLLTVFDSHPWGADGQ